MKYCVYLRKSRADTEAEARGEEETLARHEKTLIELAEKSNLKIAAFYREVVSGETIASRPIMQQLLSEVEQCLWDGVLVMEVERLARGDTIDQGIVAQAFKYSDTKIITPTKIYDPNNEYDEEYFEFGLFMSRREYKTINRRLQRGRTASVKEGKYVGNIAPYGYERIHIKNNKGYTLSPIKNEADIITLIFEWYTIGEKQYDGTYKRLGTGLISRKLNFMKIPTKKGGLWSPQTIHDILINPIYIGKIRWNWRKSHKKIIDGKIVISRPRASKNEYILTDGLHSPIISEETFNLANEFMSKNSPSPISENKTVKNPLAGIVICGKCGRHMVRRPYGNGKQPDILICPSPYCNNVSSALNIVEKRIIETLEQWLGEYKLKWNISKHSPKEKISQIEIQSAALNKQKNELDILSKQLHKTYDLFEREIYDKDTFFERLHSVTDRISEITKNIKLLENKLFIDKHKNETVRNIIPTVEKLIDVYNNMPTPKAKNEMLKNIIEKVIFTKEYATRWHISHDNFKITLYPKIPIYKENK